MTGWTVKFEIEDRYHKQIEPLFEDITHSMFKRSETLWQVELFSEEPFDVKAIESKLSDTFGFIPDVECLPLPECNWLEQTYRNFPPFILGPFFVYGQHVEAKECPENKIPLCIDASTAFGTGEHPTTEGCLQALIWLKEQEWRPSTALDMGCGTGILGFAAAKLWEIPVLCIDNDPEATEKAEENLKLNFESSTQTASVITGDGFNALEEGQCFDLILANIVAGPLKEMSADLTETLNKSGYCILSGILDEQADGVAETYSKHGLNVAHKIRIAGWTTLVMRK